MTKDTLSGEAIAVTGSPNTTRVVSFDVRQGHIDADLLGSLVAFETEVHDAASGSSRRHLVLGQVAEAATTNRWHEDPGFKDYLKRKGTLPHLTGSADVTTGTLDVLGSYGWNVERQAWTKSPMAVPCGSGRAIRRVDASVVRALMAGEHGHCYLGSFYGAADVPAPVFTRHFGSSERDPEGAGEAFIGGVFGPSGSGKTVMGLSLATLWARHSGMGFLFLDPQSEMATNQVSGGTRFGYDFHEQLRQASGGRFTATPGADIFSIDHIRLEGVELFLRILAEKRFFERLAISPAKIETVLSTLGSELDDLQEMDLWEPGMTWDESCALDVPVPDDDDDARKGQGGSFHPFKEWLCRTVVSDYSSKDAKLKQVRKNMVRPILRTAWDEAALFFSAGNGKGKLQDVVSGVLKRGRIVIVDLNPHKAKLSEALKNDIMLVVFKAISAAAERAYRDKSPVNGMVVLDEAHAFIPEQSNDARVKVIAEDLTAKAKMLRKLGVGMLFMTQRVTGIRSDIYAQMHFRVYGQGLKSGGDATNIRNVEGPTAQALYEALPDPRLTGNFSFMVAGSLVALGSTGQPMFVTGFKSGRELMDANKGILPSFVPTSNAGRSAQRRLDGVAATPSSGPRSLDDALSDLAD